MGFWTSKPPVGVALNRGHPLANGLLLCLTLSEGSGVRLTDVVSSQTAAPTHASGIGLSWATDIYGPVLAHDNTGTGDASSHTLTAPVSGTPTDQEFSLWVRWYHASTGQQDTMIRADTVTGEQIQFRVESNNTFSLLRAAVFQYTESTTTVTAGWHDFAVTYSQKAGVFRYYLDAIDAGGGSTSGTFNLVGPLNLGGSNGEVAFNGARSAGMMTYNRALSAAEVAALTRSPYEMFAAPLWRRSFVPAAGGGGGAVAARRLPLLGVG